MVAGPESCVDIGQCFFAWVIGFELEWDDAARGVQDIDWFMVDGADPLGESTGVAHGGGEHEDGNMCGGEDQGFLPCLSSVGVSDPVNFVEDDAFYVGQVEFSVVGGDLVGVE